MIAWRGRKLGWGMLYLFLRDCYCYRSSFYALVSKKL